MINNIEKMMAIIDNDCFSGADVAILLEGDGENRIGKAVELYKEGKVKKIVFSGNIGDRAYGSFPFSELEAKIRACGVHSEDLLFEDISKNTREQAIEIIKMATTNGWKKLALIASAEHQYRAYLTILRVIIDRQSEILLYNTPARNLNWFEDEGWGLRIDRLDAELSRIAKYTEMGHLANYDELIWYQRQKEEIENDQRNRG